MPLLPADTPRLPKWPFLVGDAMLIGLAFVIGTYAHNPFVGKPLILIVLCVALGAVLAAVPFVADYARQQDEALDERQRGLEALAHTITSSAEQISIAAQSLPGIAEAAANSLKLAEQLPGRLQEEAGESKARLAEMAAAGSETLALEVAALRASESKRLETMTDQIRQAAADLAKAELAGQKNLGAARAELEAKAGQIFAQLDAKLAALSALAEKLLVRPARAEQTPATQAEPATPADEPARGEAPRPAPGRHAQGPAPIETLAEAAGRVESIPVALPDRAEDPAAVASMAAESHVEESKLPRKRAPKKAKSESSEPSLDFAGSTEDPAAERDLASAGREPARPERVEGGRPSADSAIPSSAGGDEFSQPSPEEDAPASSLSADGATRLLVTAYIGIGNKLFLRGDGAGLGWDKGVPLQFVSIGKWRWETAEATTPIRVKLYKNDDVECATLGELTLEPGRQTEATAVF